jgi:RNA polymerase-binding transcription factor DksA
MQNPITLRAERARLLRLLLERHATELAACKHELRGSADGVDAVEGLESTMNRESRGLGAAMASIQSRTVQLIETSLRRLESGTYGRCSECDGPIAWVRLNALPFADACRDCQERRDQARGAFPILV